MKKKIIKSHNLIQEFECPICGYRFSKLRDDVYDCPCCNEEILDINIKIID